MRKRLLLADDHELMLAGVSQILAAECEVVGKVGDGRTLVAEARRLSPDVIVLDLGMPILNGVEATRQIMAHAPATKIVVFTQQLSGTHVSAAFRAGARAYVAKQAATAELLKALRAVLQGRYYLTSLAVPNQGGKPRSGVMDENPGQFFSDPLTPRQRQVLGLIAQGKSAKEVASALNISVKTVDFHRGILMDELGLRTTAELTRYAVTNGLTSDS